MINLLPDETKQDIRAARMNVILLRYNFFMLIAVGILLGFCLSFYVVLGLSQSIADEKNQDNIAKAASYNDVRKAADEYKSNLTLASKILDSSVTYTSSVFELAKLLPSGVTIDDVVLNASDFGKEISLTAHAKGYTQATQLKQNLQDAKLLSNAYFQSVTEEAGDAESQSAYPITVVIRAQLNKLEGQ